MEETKQKKKFNWALFIFVVLLIVVAVAVLFGPQIFSTGQMLNEGTILDNSTCSKLPSEVVMFYSTGCPHCMRLLPIMQKTEKDLNMSFSYFSVDSDMKTIQGFGLAIKGVPTMIINCKVHLGETTEDNIKNWILENQAIPINATAK